MPESVAVERARRAPHDITAHVTVPDDLDVLEGVLAVQGSVLGGWSFHLLGDGRLCYVHNLAGWREYRVEADIGRARPGRPHARLPLPARPRPSCWSTARWWHGEVKRTVWSRFSLTGAGLTAGWSPDFSPADRDYRGRFAFTGVLHRVDIDVDGPPGGGRRSRGGGHHRLAVSLSEPRGEQVASRVSGDAAGAGSGRAAARPPPPG